MLMAIRLESIQFNLNEDFFVKFNQEYLSEIIIPNYKLPKQIINLANNLSINLLIISTPLSKI